MTLAPTETTLRRAGRGVARLAGAAGLAVLLPALILAVGLPVALLVRAIVWLLM